MTTDRLLPELGPSPLEEAYMILARQTRLLPTRAHLDALDQMHRDRYARLLDEYNIVEERIRHLQQGLHEIAEAMETHRWSQE